MGRAGRESECDFYLDHDVGAFSDIWLGWWCHRDGIWTRSGPSCFSPSYQYKQEQTLFRVAPFCRLAKVCHYQHHERARAIPRTVRTLVSLAQKARHPCRSLVCRFDGLPQDGPQVRRPPYVLVFFSCPIDAQYWLTLEMEELPEVQRVCRTRIARLLDHESV